MPSPRARTRGSYFVDRVALDDAVADDAVDGSAARVEEAHVVVDLGRCCDSRARVAGRVLLLDGDGGREAVDHVYVGLLDAFEELPCVGGQRLDVAALAFSIDGVEGERGFARTGNSRNDGQLAVRYVAVNIFEVVHPRAADGDLVRQCSESREKSTSLPSLIIRRSTGYLLLPPGVRVSFTYFQELTRGSFPCK